MNEEQAKQYIQVCLTDHINNQQDQSAKTGVAMLAGQAIKALGWDVKTPCEEATSCKDSRK